MASGLSEDGLEIESIDDIRTDIEQDLRDAFYESLPLGDKTLLGHLVGVLSNQLGLLWERLEQVNSAQDPDKATGQALDAVAVLTGTFRQAATSSFVTLVLCGDDATQINEGSVVATESTSTLWNTRDTVTLAALDAWVASTAYAIDDEVTNEDRCYRCISAGTSAASGGPTTATDDETDGTVHWTYLGEGTATAEVVADADDTGPIVAVAHDLRVIQTPVAGWSSARNLLDATEGADEATDEELRLVRQLELAGSGATTRDAIRAEILRITGVISCSVFVNRTDTTDGDGVPPHAFECLVREGADQDIVNTIGDNLPIGIATYGSSSGTFTDSEGNTETISFSRPTEKLIYAVIYVNVDADDFPSTGAAAIKNAVVEWGDEFPTGKDVDPSAVGAQAFDVAGVEGVTNVLIYDDVIDSTPSVWTVSTAYVATVGARSCVTNDGGRVYICTTAGTSAGSGGPTGVGTAITDGTCVWRFLGNIYTIGTRDLAVFDTSRVTVVATPV